jgi:hypothetical protein
MNKRWVIMAIATALGACVLIAIAAFVVGRSQIEAVGRWNAARTLAGSLALQAHLDAERMRALEAETQRAASDAAFVDRVVAAMHFGDEGSATPDAGTLHDLVESERTHYAFDSAALLDASGKTLATSGDGYLYRRDVSNLASVSQVRKGAVLASGMFDADARVYRVGVAALTRPGGVAAIFLGARHIDEDTMRSSAAMDGAERAFVAFVGGRPQIAATTLDPDDAQALANLAAAQHGAWSERASAAKQEPFAIELNGQAWYAVLDPFDVQGSSTLRLLLVPPAWRAAVASALAPPLQIGAALAICAVLAALVLYWLRTVKPITLLDQLARRAQHGDYALHGAETGSTSARAAGRVVNALLAELARHRVPPGSPRRRASDFHTE